MTNEGGKTCPVCTEEMDLTDLQLKPCKCGYQVCVWCWHHIMDMAEKDGTEGRCPACRTPYDKEKIVSMAASVEFNSERKPKPQKVKSRTYEGRKHLSNVRVVQRHLVYTMGIPANLADEDLLQRREYFGQYGKVLKASLTRTSGGAIQYSANNTCSVYITYAKEEEAVRCIQSVHGYILQGQSLRACFGTTKYCHAWLRNMPCSNPDCVYLHDVGNQEDSFTKDEIVSAYTRSRVQQITAATNNLERRAGDMLPPPVDDFSVSTTASSKPISRSPSDNPSSQLKISPPNSSSGRSMSLPAAASWGLRVSNGHSPTTSSAISNGPAKQKHDDSNGSVGFPSLVASTTPPAVLNADVGKKAWVTKEGRASNSNRELGSLEYPKQQATVDPQKILPDTLREEVQDAASTVEISRELPFRSSSINIPSTSNGHSWSYDDDIGMSDPISRYPPSVHTKDDEVVHPFAPIDPILSNGYTENHVSTSAGLENIFEHSNVFSSLEKGKYLERLDNNPVDFGRNNCVDMGESNIVEQSKYLGRLDNNPVDSEKNTSVDIGESNIISNILSMDFDAWDESHNFAKLLSETDNQLGGMNIRSSRKEQKSSQSRFSFARQVDFADQATDSGFSRNIGDTMNRNSASQIFQDNQDMRFDDLPNGLSCNFLEESDSFYSGNSSMPSNRFSVSRAPVSAPPGFSVPNKVPPPGFSVQERMDNAFEGSAVNHFLGNSSMLRSQYHLQPTTEMTSMEDVELIDPAILAVGTGRPVNGMNDYGLDIRSTPSMQLGASENDPRFQLLRQQFLPQQRSLRYNDHVGDRFSSLTDAYNNPSRYLEQSQYAQLSSLQPRTERVLHGWNSWNETQSSNGLDMLELLKNERYGYNQYYPEYENRNSRLPKPNDLYNNAFGM